ncbi:MAG: hypothetical protein N2559_14955 [Anaerolineae bacterium]|nr:hypothetical protein [Anaerolineae bacterium]
MQNDTQNPPLEIQPQPLTALDRFWLETARGAAKESVGALEDAAKQLIAITSLSQGIYFAAISFGDIKKVLPQFALAWQWTITAALVLPLVCWLVALFFAIRVFVPRVYATNLDSPDLARETYERVAAYKHTQLRRAHLALVLGFVPLIVNIVLFWRL